MVTKRISAAKTASKKEVKPQDTQLRDYELVVIFKPELEEDKTNLILDNVSKYVTSHEGAIGNVDRWGKKKLAYPIKHFLEGKYILTRFKMKPAFSKELEGNLRLSEDILRHLLVQVD